jgi:hypothetical protein
VRGPSAPTRSLPYEMEQRPADGLRSGFAQQVFNRGHHESPFRRGCFRSAS